MGTKEWRRTSAPILLIGAVLAASAGCGAPGGTVKTGQVSQLVDADGSTPTAAPTSDRPAPSERPASTPAATASTEVRVQTVTRTVAFHTIERDDPELPEGETVVARAGRAGRLVLTYRVTYVDGTAAQRVLAGKRIVKEPIDRIVEVGTRPAEPAGSDCDPNYTGDCVPVASDVDCAAGTGNGPEYVAGPVTVVGEDIYGLDRDGDGVGCE